MAKSPARGQRARDAAPRKFKKKTSPLVIGKVEYVDYKDVDLLSRFMSDRGKIRGQRINGNDVQQQREVANAEEEGVDFRWLSAPQAFLGENHVRAVQAQKIHLGQPDATGRQVPQVIEDSSHEIPADLVIKALGFDPEDIPAMFGAPELEVSKWGTIGVDWRTMMTNLPGVFAAGDIVRGASLVVWGVRDGRDAAESIHSYIMARSEAPRSAAAGA